MPQLEFRDDPILRKLCKQEPVDELLFELNPEEPGEPAGRLIETADLLPFWCQQMLGHCFEVVKPSIEEMSYHDGRKKCWPSVLQFFYHCRNACFHGNCFNILDNAISKEMETAWRGKEIISGENGTKLAGEFLLPADFFVLLFDVQTLLADG